MVSRVEIQCIYVCACFRARVCLFASSNPSPSFFSLSRLPHGCALARASPRFSLHAPFISLPRPTPTESDAEMMKNGRLLSREGAFACFHASVCVSYLCCALMFTTPQNRASPLAWEGALCSHYQASARLHDFPWLHVVGSGVYEHVSAACALVRSFTLGTSGALALPSTRSRPGGAARHGPGDASHPHSSPVSSPSPEMIELDGDEERISSQGRYAERDIVQVCPLSRTSGGPWGSMMNEQIRPLRLCSAFCC